MRDNQVVFQVMERVKPDLAQLTAERARWSTSCWVKNAASSRMLLLNSLVKRYQDDKLIQVNQPLLDRILS